MSMNDEAAKKAAADAQAAKAKADAEARENAAKEAEAAKKAAADKESQALRDRVAQLEAELAERNAPVPESKNPFGTITVNAKNQVVED